MEELGLGKLERRVLEPLLRKYLPVRVYGLDANPLDEEHVIATNPALGVPLETLGFFAFHYTASNVACKFAKPLYATLTLVLPPGSALRDVEEVLREFGAEAKKYGVAVVGGHTGVYKGVTLPVAVTTVIGRRTRLPEPPAPGDVIVLLGEVGLEAVWLHSLSRGSQLPRELWRCLTPLPAALALAEVRGVKVMHDVSEGGVLGALLELAQAHGLRLRVSSGEVPLAEGVGELGINPLKAPSYGVLLAVVGEEAVEDVSRRAASLGLPWAVIGEVVGGKAGVEVDGVEYARVERTPLDELYGTIPTLDPVKAALESALARLDGSRDVASLIPEVGMNLVYAKPGAVKLSDVAGLSGRIVKSLGRARVCGKVAYGGSRHLARVVLAALKWGVELRAAVNVRGGKEVARALRRIGLRVVDVEGGGGTCPIADYISERGVEGDAYYHRGAHGVEPSIVILGRSPGELVETLFKLAAELRRGCS